MLTWTTLILVVVLIMGIYWFVKQFHISVENRIQALPGLRPEWLFGNLRNTGITSSRVAFHEALTNLKEKYGDAYSFWFGPHYGIILSRIELVRQVLADRQTYDQSYMVSNAFAVLCPTGLIALRGDKWKRHARLMVPIFRGKKVTRHFNTVVTCVNRWIDEQLVPYNGKINSDLVKQSQRLSLNIIAYVAFDYDVETSSIAGKDLQQAFYEFVRYANQFVFMGGIPKWLGYSILTMHFKFQRASRILKHHIINIIAKEEKRQEQESTASNQPKSLITSLVAAIKDEKSSTGPLLTSTELFDEIVMSILGGFETTSSTLSWFIFYMSKYPHVQQKMKDELREHHLMHATELGPTALDSLIYIECVTKEVLRYAPIATGVVREAMCDDVLGNIQVRKGDNIMIAIQNLHRDPRYWNIDPTKFVPERFLDEDKYPPLGAYMPFGGGHRSCIGQDLAFFNLKTIIVCLMQRVTFVDPDDEANNSGGYIQNISCFPNHFAVRVWIDSDETKT